MVPRALTHHVTFADGSTADGASVAVGVPTNLVLASPVGAGDWWIGLGPSNTSEHRRAVIRVGDDTVPHLHFHVTEAPDSVAAPLRGEGVPFLLDSFTVVNHDPERIAQHARLTGLGLHRAALPVEGDVVRVLR